MKTVYSFTLNISPFFRLEDGAQFTKLSKDDQKIRLISLMRRLKELIHGDFGHYVYEYTKRKDYHIHGLVTTDEGLTPSDFYNIERLGSYFGNNKFNRPIYMELCRDGGTHWRTNYMEKEQHLHQETTVDEDGQENIGIPITRFITKKEGGSQTPDKMK